MTRISARRCCALIVLSLSLVPGLARASARTISEAERSAVEVAASYLSRGPQAVVEQLAVASRFHGTPNLQDEIEVRLGPPAGATWELQTVVPALEDKMAVFTISYPSGIDETVIFDLVQESGRFKISDIRILADKSQRQPYLPPLAEVPRAEASKAPRTPRMPFYLGLAGAAIAAIATFMFRENKRAARKMMLGAPLSAVAALGFLFMGDNIRFSIHRPQPPPPPVQITDDGARLAPLLPLRRAIAAGSAEAETLLHKVRENRSYANLWKAQLDLQQMNIDAVKRTLASFPATSDIPMVEILRARVALFLNNEAASAMAYEHAVNLGPGRDGLWHETAEALSVLGFQERASRYFQRLAKIGSRDGAVYYALASQAAMENDQETAERHLRDGWRLRPAERARLVETAVLWSVLRRQGTALDVNLSLPAEPTVQPGDVSSRPIVLPPGAEARVSGRFLDVMIGDQELLVPGGAMVAPVGTPAVEASAWARTEEERGLRDLPLLIAMPRNAGAFAQPALRKRIARTASALASRNRWEDLVQLTSGLSPTSEHIPSELFFLRTVALQRTKHDHEAQTLLNSLASSPVLMRKRDAQALAELAEMLAAYDQYDSAIRMYDKSQSIRPNGIIDERVRQIQMNRRLATNYAVARTEHFEVHYPSDITQQSGAALGRILEAEYARLQKWVPTPNFRPVIVNVLWWREFRSTYTGSDFILGFYQSNKITVPLAGVNQYIPEIVSLLTHELCHAMISQATNDQAPRWFQEGLAQRVEMRPYHSNAFNMYEDNKLLAVSLLDAVMGGSPDPAMISEAYIESQTVIRYVEARYGAAGIHRLLEAYKEGATTDGAILKLASQSTPDFDTQLRNWGRTGSTVFENPEPVHYEAMEDPSMKWAKPAPPANLKTMPRRGGIGGTPWKG